MVQMENTCPVEHWLLGRENTPYKIMDALAASQRNGRAQASTLGCRSCNRHKKSIECFTDPIGC